LFHFHHRNYASAITGLDTVSKKLERQVKQNENDNFNKSILRLHETEEDLLNRKNEYDKWGVHIRDSDEVRQKI